MKCFWFGIVKVGGNGCDGGFGVVQQMVGYGVVYFGVDGGKVLIFGLQVVVQCCGGLVQIVGEVVEIWLLFGWDGVQMGVDVV